MNEAILTAVAKFTELKSDKNYKLSALVQLCEDYVFNLRHRNIVLCKVDFYDFLFSLSREELKTGKLQ